MQFSESSEITLMLTSCGRFDLLKRTLESFDKFNTMPIREVIITEDSGQEAVHDCVPLHWLKHTKVIVNNPCLGQLSSIDLAYEQIKTSWVFHCEDDWEFYRPGFIEDSLALLEADPQALQVWLRSYIHDLRLHSPYVFLGERKLHETIAFHQLCSHKQDWQGFSFNPGLRRLIDYQEHAPYARHGGEKNLSKIYAAQNRYALILENSAVLHTGFGEHVEISDERVKKLQRKRRVRYKLLAVLLIGIVTGWCIHAF
jgi:hypothetical protein